MPSQTPEHIAKLEQKLKRSLKKTLQHTSKDLAVIEQIQEEGRRHNIFFLKASELSPKHYFHDECFTTDLHAQLILEEYRKNTPTYFVGKMYASTWNSMKTRKVRTRVVKNRKIICECGEAETLVCDKCSKGFGCISCKSRNSKHCFACSVQYLCSNCAETGFWKCKSCKLDKNSIE